MLNNKEQAKTTLQQAYYALAGNNLTEQHKELTEAILDALRALGEYNTPKAPDTYYKGTEVGALAYIHNTIFTFELKGEGWTDEQTDAFFNIPFTALEAIADAPSTCKEDTEAKIGVIRTQYADYDLDEIQKLTLRTLERELTGKTGKWGKDDILKPMPENLNKPEARTKQEDENINEAIEALKWLSSKGLKLSVGTLENLAKGQ